MSHHWFSRFLLTTVGAVALASFAASPAEAQDAAGSRSILHVDGTLQGVSRLLVKIADAEGTEYLVQLPQDVSRVRFHADADPQGLRPGVMVRFQGSFGPGGVPLEPIKQVEIFHPIRDPKMPRHVAESVTPGIYPETPPAANVPPGFVPGKYRVVGSLIGVAPSGLMAVSAGQYPLRVQLDPEAKFVVRTHSLELAQPGDRVTLDGFYNEPDKTKVLADSLTIVSERVIGAAEEPAPKGRRRRGRAAKVEAEAEVKVEAEAEAGAKVEAE